MQDKALVEKSFWCKWREQAWAEKFLWVLCYFFLLLLFWDARKGLLKTILIQKFFRFVYFFYLEARNSFLMQISFWTFVVCLCFCFVWEARKSLGWNDLLMQMSPKAINVIPHLSRLPHFTTHLAANFSSLTSVCLETISFSSKPNSFTEYCIISDVGSYFGTLPS